MPAAPHADALSLREELASAITHGLGAVASVIAGSVLIALAAMAGSPAHVVGAVVFVSALVLLYTASTLYHAIPHPVPKARLKVLDHCAIYVLIAGTYTPFLLGGLRGPWGWSLFALIWTLAAAGIVFKLFTTGRFTRVSTAIYVAMGWLIVAAAGPMRASLPSETIGWLVAGGVAYTGGTVFYLSRRLPFAHAVWHLFVLAGSAFHLVAAFIEVLRIS